MAYSARADLTVCNKGDGDMIVAFSYSEGMPAGQYRNLGWLKISAKQCQTYTDLVVDKETFYYYAEDEVGNRWSDGDESPHRMCISQGARFDDVYAGQKTCPRKNMLVRGFRKVETGDSRHYRLNLTGSVSRAQQLAEKIDRLDIGDGVYIQGAFSDELAYIVRINKTDNTVKVRHAEDGTARWVGIEQIITRDQAQQNSAQRSVVGGAIIFCLFAPEQCK
ncbi:DUF1036 domain-containing protein [Idiomarina xiamenensis]|nr:DUF1036 domain-containing protein [Idiomarina xiamenensis]